MSSAAQLQIPVDGPVIRVPIDITQPLPGQIRAWVDQHASPLIRALLNEADRLHGETRAAIASRRAAEQRVVNLEERCATLADYARELQEVAVGATTDAARDVLAERRRQVEQEGWTEAHDDEHALEELAAVAALYALPSFLRHRRSSVSEIQGAPTTSLERAVWPSHWSEEWWKPTPDDRRRELVKAAALLLAEIERIDRRRARAAQSAAPALLQGEAPDPAMCPPTLNGQEAHS